MLQAKTIAHPTLRSKILGVATGEAEAVAEEEEEAEAEAGAIKRK
jgi:hypothetical protein